jgi:hypothetical protein
LKIYVMEADHAEAAHLEVVRALEIKAERLKSLLAVRPAKRPLIIEFSG